MMRSNRNRTGAVDLKNDSQKKVGRNSEAVPTTTNFAKSVIPGQNPMLKSMQMDHFDSELDS